MDDVLVAVADVGRDRLNDGAVVYFLSLRRLQFRIVDALHFDPAGPQIPLRDWKRCDLLLCFVAVRRSNLTCCFRQKARTSFDVIDYVAGRMRRIGMTSFTDQGGFPLSPRGIRRNHPGGAKNDRTLLCGQ
jgi:hypothetical protein